jgi:hypothetical protein
MPHHFYKGGGPLTFPAKNPFAPRSTWAVFPYRGTMTAIPPEPRVSGSSISVNLIACASAFQMLKYTPSFNRIGRFFWGGRLGGPLLKTKLKARQ